jgi:hypothetical protein
MYGNSLAQALPTDAQRHAVNQEMVLYEYVTVFDSLLILYWII